MKLVGLLHHPAVGLCEEKLVELRTVDDDAVEPGGVVVARSVKFSLLTRVEDAVHEEVWHGVG